MYAFVLMDYLTTNLRPSYSVYGRQFFQVSGINS